MSVNTQSSADPDPGSELTGDEPGAESAPDANAEADAAPESLPLDQVFDVLKNERRRTVLRYLDEHEEPISLGDLSEHVAADENDIPVAQISSRERKCAYVGLYQCHLPKMDDMNIISFNQNRGLIEAGPNEEQLKQYLDWAEEPTRPWPLFYAAAAGTGFVGVVLGLALGSTPVGLALCVAALAAVVGIALFQLSEERADESPVDE